MAKILDGKKLAEKILENLKREIKKKRLKLKLAVVLVDQDQMFEIFIRQKERACQKVGIDFELFKFFSGISQLKLRKAVEEIAKDPGVSGIVIQLPLPKNFNTDEILNLIPSKKNVEFFSPVVCAVSYFLREYKISLRNKNIVLVGKGRLVGKPLAEWLVKKKVKFQIVDKSTEDISSFTKRADILISGVGKLKLITGKMVKRGVVVIDAGGDVDFKSVSKKASYLTPIPGGVGPLTVACLLENLIKLNS